MIIGNSSCGANLTGVNSVSSAALWRQWRAVNVSWQHYMDTNHTHPYPPLVVVAAWWEALAEELGEALRVELLHATDCGLDGGSGNHGERCIGFNWRMDCVCYQ